MSKVEDMVEDIGRPIVVATHPRSGTHLTIDLLRKQFEECKGWLWFWEPLSHLYLNLDRLDENTKPGLTLEKAQNILQRADRPIVKTHSTPSLDRFTDRHLEFAEALIRKAEIIYVIRDVRDVLCSAHIWRQEYDPSARCSFSRFIRQKEKNESRVKRWASHVESWTSNSKVNVIRFEDILSSPGKVVEKFSEILGENALRKKPYLPEKAKHRNKLNDYLKRIIEYPESTAILGRYKNKEPKKWKKVSTKNDKKLLKKRASKTLKKFGYSVNKKK
ncbi:sulfotransferase domain-containing protein [Salinibacter ruber]|uniref:sulfotransferase domain-containing protein n=1 Tax=Salinibacter ruber TaxID=146919 RepID=UPI002169698A|nr:sulfotransferase domain-containing protein [Salinibacter ruber]MCS3642382.1 hypothetical protein [Salinibacter ruber]